MTVRREIHPDWYHPIVGMVTLIVGSYPPVREKWDFLFYYPNKQNRMWQVLAQIAHKPLVHFNGEEAVKERKSLMKDLRVGVQNIGRGIERKSNSSLDSNITIYDYHDILSLIQSNQSLTTIILTGYSGTYSALNTFKRYLRKNKIKYSWLQSHGEARLFHFEYGRKIKCVVVNSTSTRACSIPLEKLLSQFRLGLGL